MRAEPLVATRSTLDMPDIPESCAVSFLLFESFRRIALLCGAVDEEFCEASCFGREANAASKCPVAPGKGFFGTEEGVFEDDTGGSVALLVGVLRGGD